ncbi:MFS transporter [Streptomyces sp. NPDC058052]|uniref:MFS transporter n=1 Tax=Streptomyces sp. NPDC058052 TaxID=3346316 RepID=UPI0036ED3F5B
MSSAPVDTTAPHASTPPPSGRRANPWLTLIAVALGLFMVNLDGSVVSVANPEIGRDLGATTADLQAVTNAYLIAMAAALILGGKLGDRFGRRTSYLAGVAGFVVASVMIGLIGSVEGVIAFRALQGLCAALLIPNTLGLLRAVFPPERFGTAVGLWAMVASCSTALGPIVGGLLVEHVSWESVFFINVPIGAATLAFGALVLPRSKDSTGRHGFDLPGVVLLALGLVALVLGVVKGETWGWTSAGTLGSLAAGLLLLVLFARYETRVAHPLLPMRLFRSPALTTGTLVTAVNFFVMLGVIFFLMLYLQNVRGLTPVEVGVRTLPMSLASVVAAPLGAALTGRFGARVTMPAGMALEAVAALWMTTWDTQSPYAALWPPFLLIGLGVGMVMSASSDAIVGNAPVRDGGVAGGLQATALQVGGALGTSVLVSLISGRVGATLTGELTGAGVPPAVAEGLAGAKDAVAMGIAPVTDAMPAALRTAVVEGSGNAFMNGVHTAALVTTALCVAGGLLAAVGLRRPAPATTAPAATAPATTAAPGAVPHPSAASPAGERPRAAL